MISDLVAYSRNYFLDRLWRLGFEEIIGPLGPLRVAERASRSQPQHEPWRVAVPQLVEAAVARDIANKAQNKVGLQSATQTIQNLIDDYCGTPPRKIPWPFPGPPPWAWQIASELSLFASNLQDGGLRGEIDAIVARIGRGTTER